MRPFRVLAVLAILLIPTSVSNAAKKPNILFLFADDQCYETIRAYGHTDIETPNLDRLAKRGVTFTRAYNMGSWSGAVCVASRAMLTTGRYLWRANKVARNAEKERAGRSLLARIHEEGRYETFFTGKWHVRAKAEKAFDHAAHIRGGMPRQTPAGYNRPKSITDDNWKPWDKKFGGFWQGGTHWSEVVANDTVGFLKHAAKNEKPFFMYIAFNAAHDPRQAPKSYVDKYPLERIKVPVNYPVGISA